MFARSSPKRRKALLETALLGDTDLERLERERNSALTLSQRFELVFELSDFIAEMHHAGREAKRHGKVRK